MTDMSAKMTISSTSLAAFDQHRGVLAWGTFVLSLVIVLFISQTIIKRKLKGVIIRHWISNGDQPWIPVEYRWEKGMYYPAQVLGKENHSLGTYTVRFYWGCLQPSTYSDQIKWNKPCEKPEDYVSVSSAKSEIQEAHVTEPDIWMAARRGDFEGVKQFASQMKNIDELEPVGNTGQQGRSALYWACLTGRVEIVEYLLEIGAKDFDGSAFQAATCADPIRAKADKRDLLFDPDANIFTDNIVREAIAKTDGSDDASKKIRALLTFARADGLIPIPQAIFDRPSNACCVCFEAYSMIKPPAVCSPCGHSATCLPCLKKIRKEREQGCPVCRGRIRKIIPLVDVPDTRM